MIPLLLGPKSLGERGGPRIAPSATKRDSIGGATSCRNTAPQSGLFELLGSLQQKVAEPLHLGPCAVPHALAVRHDQIEHNDRFNVGVANND
jgi:hypothetical protein